MIREIHFPLAVRLATTGGALLLATLVFAGCSNSQAESGRNADLKPDDGDNDAKSSSSDDSDGGKSGLPQQPSTAVPVTADPLALEIPSEPKEILVYIQKLQHRPPARNEQEGELMLMSFEKTITAAEKLLAATEDEELLSAAIEAKVMALSQLAGRGLDGAEKRLRTIVRHSSPVITKKRRATPSMHCLPSMWGAFARARSTLTAVWQS